MSWQSENSSISGAGLTGFRGQVIADCAQNMFHAQNIKRSWYKHVRWLDGASQHELEPDGWLSWLMLTRAIQSEMAGSSRWLSESWPSGMLLEQQSHERDQAVVKL